jgi:hypothetical protein
VSTFKIDNYPSIGIVSCLAGSTRPRTDRAYSLTTVHNCDTTFTAVAHFYCSFLDSVRRIKRFGPYKGPFPVLRASQPRADSGHLVLRLACSDNAERIYSIYGSVIWVQEPCTYLNMHAQCQTSDSKYVMPVSQMIVTVTGTLRCMAQIGVLTSFALITALFTTSQ